MKTVIYLLPFLAFNAIAQQPSAVLHDDWNFNTWNLTGGTDYFYNTEDLKTEQISKFFYSPNTWMSDEKQSSYYNPLNQHTSLYFIRFNGIEWADTTGRNLFEYNASGQLITETSELYFPTYWENEQRTTYTYGSTNDVHIRLAQMWDNNNNQWVNVSRSVYSYSPNQIQEIFYVWNGSYWLTQGRTTSTLNIGNAPVLEISDGWNGNNWTPGIKVEYHYTNFGKISDRSWYSYSTEEGDYVHGDSTHFTYNGNQTINTITSLSYDHQTDVWTNLRRDRYVYDSQLGLKEETDLTFVVYPNPSSDFISVNASEIGSLKIIDLQGKIWKEETEMKSNIIEISNYPQGMYFIQFQTKDQLKTESFVKQ